MPRHRATNDLHPIQVVARRTGLTPDVLRAWEKRHAAVVPVRTPGNRRLYTDVHIERLLLLHKATLAGRSISQVAALDTDRLRALVAGDLAEGAPRLPAAAPSASAGPAVSRPSEPFEALIEADSYLDAALAAVRDLDGARLDVVLSRASIHLRRETLLDRLLAPLMQRIGELWEGGDLAVVHEHVASSVVRSLIGALALAVEPAPSAPTLVIATPAGQFHELGALGAALTAGRAGFRVLYLGPNLPAADIARAARERQAAALALSLTFPEGDPLLVDELRSLRRSLPGLPLLVGGRAIASYQRILDEVGARTVKNFGELRGAIDEILRLRSGG
jgi:methanogenic corrinoid protein MtbC1